MGVPVSGPRLIVPSLPEPGGTASVPAAEAAHARARRLEEGQIVVLIDGSGREAAARVVRVRRDGCDVRVETVSDAPADAAAPLYLLVAAVRSERLCWIAEKASELGAARLTVVVTERTQTFRARDGLLPRLERIVRESAKQAGGSRFTTIAGPIPFGEALLGAAAGARLILDPCGAEFPAGLPAKPAAILVGPEGGFTPSEMAAARDAGWIATALPAATVRAETAAISALVLARAALMRGER